MERKKYILITIFIMLSCIIQGQNNKSIYKAYASGNMNRWKYVVDSLDIIQQKTDKELLDLINYQYGYIAWCIGNKKEKEATNYLKKATNYLKKLENKKYNISMIYAYKSAFIGFEIGLSQYKAPFIGPKSLEYAKKSISTDALNVLGYIQLGNIAYYTPSTLGGSKSEALKNYYKAFNLMESNNEYKINNWNYLNLLATLISTYIDLNQYKEAQKYCKKALTIEPNFDWVKTNLYPKVLKNIKK